MATKGPRVPSPAGMFRDRAAEPQIAKARPAAPPSAASKSDSARSCRTIRPRDAPSDSRTAISRARAAARAISRLPTLVQAINRSTATPPISASNTLAVLPADVDLPAFGDPAADVEEADALIPCREPRDERERARGTAAGKGRVERGLHPHESAPGRAMRNRSGRRSPAGRCCMAGTAVVGTAIS